MRKLAVILTIIALPMMADAAKKTKKVESHWSDKIYGKLNLGYSFFDKFKKFVTEGEDDGVYENIRPKSKPVISFALGYDYNEHLSSELQLRYSSFKYKYDGVGDQLSDIQSADLYSFFANGYYKIKRFNKVTPYLTAGAGVAYNKAGPLKQYDSAFDYRAAPGRKIAKFAWNVGAGAYVKLNSKVDIDFRYKYYNLGKVGSNQVPGFLSDSESHSLKAHEVAMGVVFKF